MSADHTLNTMIVTYKTLKAGTKVRLHDNLASASTYITWPLVTGAIESAFIADNGIQYVIRLDSPAKHGGGALLYTTTAHADNIRIL
jgi:hypothetical protein